VIFSNIWISDDIDITRFHGFSLQMADHSVVIRGIERVPSVVYSALTPNLKGFNAAVSNK